MCVGALNGVRGGAPSGRSHEWLLGGWCEGDLVAEGLELVDEVAGFAVFVEVLVVVVGAEVVEATAGIIEEVPCGHED